jgi:hypothetical protein
MTVTRAAELRRRGMRRALASSASHVVGIGGHHDGFDAGEQRVGHD